MNLIQYLFFFCKNMDQYTIIFTTTYILKHGISKNWNLIYLFSKISISVFIHFTNYTHHLMHKMNIFKILFYKL